MLLLLMFNAILIGLYCLIGFIVLCIIAVTWELVEKIIKHKPAQIKKRLLIFFRGLKNV